MYTVNIHKFKRLGLLTTRYHILPFIHSENICRLFSASFCNQVSNITRQQSW